METVVSKELLKRLEESLEETLEERLPEISQLMTLTPKSKYSPDNPPGIIEKRVFIGGNYALMPILREIEEVVLRYGFQPIIAFDFDIPLDKTRDYTLRLMFQCKYAIFEMTIPNGHLVEYIRGHGFTEMNILEVYMAMNESREPPKTTSVMSWQVDPPPRGYLTIAELKEIVAAFLTQPRTQK